MTSGKIIKFPYEGGLRYKIQMDGNLVDCDSEGNLLNCASTIQGSGLAQRNESIELECSSKSKGGRPSRIGKDSYSEGVSRFTVRMPSSVLSRCRTYIGWRLFCGESLTLAEFITEAVTAYMNRSSQFGDFCKKNDER